MRSLWIGICWTTIAAAGQVTVLGTAGPWEFNGTLNTAFSYSDDGQQTAPTIVTGFDFSAGNAFVITYISGTTTTDGNPANAMDANGYGCCELDAGHNGPGQYMTPPVFLNELVGTFTDGSGAIVGTPFAVGDGPTTVTAPAGAAQLQLGINDDQYGDNTGSLVVDVESATPEPGSWGMLGAGLALVGLSRRRWRHHRP